MVGSRVNHASEGNCGYSALIRYPQSSATQCPQYFPAPPSNSYDPQRVSWGVTPCFSGQSPGTWPVQLTQAAGTPELYRSLTCPCPPSAPSVLQHCLPVHTTASHCPLLPPSVPSVLQHCLPVHTSASHCPLLPPSVTASLSFRYCLPAP